MGRMASNHIYYKIKVKDLLFIYLFIILLLLKRFYGVCLLCRDSETGTYMLTVGQEQELLLTAVVYNNGEEAHQAILSVELPPNLDYVGTGSDV